MQAIENILLITAHGVTDNLGNTLCYGSETVGNFGVAHVGQPIEMRGKLHTHYLNPWLNMTRQQLPNVALPRLLGIAAHGAKGTLHLITTFHHSRQGELRLVGADLQQSLDAGALAGRRGLNGVTAGREKLNCASSSPNTVAAGSMPASTGLSRNICRHNEWMVPMLARSRYWT